MAVSITVNKRKCLFTDNLTVSTLLERLHHQEGLVIVTVNGRALPRSGYQFHVLQDGDVVDTEHVLLAGG